MNPRGYAGLTDQQNAELDLLASMCDEDIDTSDIPKIRDFSNLRRGMFAGSPNGRAVPKREIAQDVHGEDLLNDKRSTQMTNNLRVLDMLGRLQAFEDDLKAIGVSVNVDVSGLDVDAHEYGSREAEACVLCAAYERSFADYQKSVD